MFYKLLVFASAFVLGALPTLSPVYASVHRGNLSIAQESVVICHPVKELRSVYVESKSIPKSCELKDLFGDKEFQDLVAASGPSTVILMKEGVIVDTQHVAFDGGVITVPAAGAVATAALVVLVIIAVVVTVVIVAAEASDMINQAHEWIEVLTESKVRQEAEIDIIVEDMFDGWVTEKESREDNIRELQRVIEDLWKTIDDFLPGGSENPDGLL